MYFIHQTKNIYWLQIIYIWILGAAGQNQKNDVFNLEGSTYYGVGKFGSLPVRFLVILSAHVGFDDNATSTLLCTSESYEQAIACILNRSQTVNKNIIEIIETWWHWYSAGASLS